MSLKADAPIQDPSGSASASASSIYSKSSETPKAEPMKSSVPLIAPSTTKSVATKNKSAGITSSVETKAKIETSIGFESKKISVSAKSSASKKEDKPQAPQKKEKLTAAGGSGSSTAESETSSSNKLPAHSHATWGAEDANGGIVKPHDHDVLSGRGNSVNHHPGNEYFRSLVRHHKLAYVRCPKPQKEQFSKLIVSTVRDREPPGRFLKQNPTTKLWYNIGTQKALDKTRQALREGAPATVAGLMLSQGLTPSAAAAAGLTPSQAVSSMPGDGELASQGAATNGSNNPFLNHSHHAAAHHAAAAAAAAAANQQQAHQQHQHNAAMAAAAHSRMVSSQFYNAAAAAAAAGNYPNSPKVPAPMPPSTASSGSVKLEGPGEGSDGKSSKKKSSPPPQSPQHGAVNPHQQTPQSGPASNPYPPLPPPSSSEEAMKYHAAQVVRMATAAHAANNSGAQTNGSSSSPSTGFPASSALAAAAGTFNPVLLEHIMAQHARGAGGAGGSLPPPSGGGGGIDWNSGRQAPSPGGRGGEYQNAQYSAYPPPPNSGQHEDAYTKSQRQEAYIAHLQDRIQQQERQLLTLCSHILLSPSGAPPGPNTNNNNGSNCVGGNNGSTHHGGISHPQFAAAAKMNAAAAMANINASVAAVKELQSFTQNNPNSTTPAPTASAMMARDRANEHSVVHRHAAAIAAAAASNPSNAGVSVAPQLPVSFPVTQAPASSGTPIASQTGTPTTTATSATTNSTSTITTPSNPGTPGKKTSYSNHTNATKERSNSASASESVAVAVTASAKPPPTSEKSNSPNDDGDAVAALLALGIGAKSPSSSSPPGATSFTTGGAVASAVAADKAADDGSSSAKKKRKVAGGRRTLPIKKKQIQQQQESNKKNNNGATGNFLGPLAPQPQPQKQQQQPQSGAPMPPGMNSMIIAQNRGAVIPKPVDMTPPPELYLYGETPIHEPHVHDVLCGRGALTNEHPGNEWFRRLVRSNRQLYRSCPKHTKLLVAKAIVQAVQRTQRNPPGRFLEKTKTADGTVSNTWTPITYKSAVEKASQALREKVTPNWGAPPSNFPLHKALEAARAVAYLEKEYPSGDGFGGTNLLALIMAVVQSAGLE
mmetsp:Transcript_12874/g.30103  ORF Transcript_12874/g.30103 Transcript_12874/m.30103 type:complete len:1106 (+) Transcript_12874:38-3355(+)|eukprot:CAMPEP_0172391444 /NCGR_PEP_ID=MMETSP1061-20121228/7846_1 /TAXON_ID=37318 /ORGANISM="Pseudo-nitzschia pungens, Strain cf. pungens" /LENGTH=1105 /DNA_ID=CAMNT_0013122069 /DNA_START=37 /DNA_END=3354 /DNA_ORIENTATION=-